MKKSGLAKQQAMKLAGKMAPVGGTAFGQAPAAALDRREQRKADQAAGLVPFAVKLPNHLVTQVQAFATARGVSLNEVTAELLLKALADEPV